MFPSTSSSLFPQEIILNLHYSRKLLLLNSPIQPLNPITTQAPSPTYQVLDDSSGSSHGGGGGGGGGFDANIVMILGVLVCALICSLCINTFIRCVIKCSSLITGEPTYYLNMINHNNNNKKKCCGLDKRALKTFPMVKYSKEVKIQGLSSSECVICLCEYKGGENIRVLPICNHGFHAKCIDKWLRFHSSCPTCRQSLVETCNKIIDGCGGDDHQTTSPPPPPLLPPPPPMPSTPSREVIVVSIVPLEREDLVRNYRSSEVDDHES